MTAETKLNDMFMYYAFFLIETYLGREYPQLYDFLFTLGHTKMYQDKND